MSTAVFNQSNTKETERPAGLHIILEYVWS
jgi:hypothetical protein